MFPIRDAVSNNLSALFICGFTPLFHVTSSRFLDRVKVSMNSIHLDPHLKLRLFADMILFTNIVLASCTGQVILYRFFFNSGVYTRFLYGKNGILSPELMTPIIITVVGGTILTPILLKLVFRGEADSRMPAHGELADRDRSMMENRNKGGLLIEGWQL